MEKILSSTHKIRFQDCDPFNHLNNSKYIDYMLNAREDHLKEYYDLDIYSLARKEKISWFVTSHQIAYLKPCSVMEEIAIESQLLLAGKSNLLVEKRMYNKDKRTLKSVLWTQYTHVDLLKNTKKLHSETFMDLFKSVEIKISELTLDERCAVLSQCKQS